MENPAVSARPRVSGGCASLTSLLVSDELSIFLKSADFRRFLFGLLLLSTLLLSLTFPTPASAFRTTCDAGAGEFPDPFSIGDCYECPDGYTHDALFPVGIPGVCYQRINGTKAVKEDGASFLCPADSFYSVFNNRCNTCPAGFIADGVSLCVKVTAKTGIDVGAFRFSCPAGNYPDGNNCYTCPTTHSQIAFQNKCDGPNLYRAQKSCGSRSKTCTPTCLIYVGTTCVLPGLDSCSAWKYTPGAPGCGTRTGNSYYNCSGGGYSANPLAAFLLWSDPTKCINPNIVNATKTGTKGCDAGEFDGGNSRCYTCNFPGESGWGPALVQLPGTPGLCARLPEVVAYTPVSLPQFLCPAGEFIGPDLTCYSCAPGYQHDSLIAVDKNGVCFQRDHKVAAFVEPGKSTESCVGLGQGTCADSLVCDLFGGECRSEMPQSGELCDSTVIPCATSDLDGKPVDLACHSNGFGEPFRCVPPKQLGEVCSGLLQGSCDDNMLCAATYDLQSQGDFSVLEVIAPVALNTLAATGTPFEIADNVFSNRWEEPGQMSSLQNFPISAAQVLDPLKLRCIPQPKPNQFLKWDRFSEAECKNLHSWAVANKVTQQQPRNGKRWAYTYSMAGSAGVGLQESSETGVIYEPASSSPGDGYEGRYGCYQKNCTGVQASAGLELSACMGSMKDFPGGGYTSIEHISDSDIFAIFPVVLTSGLSVIRTYDDLNSDVTGFNGCTYTGLGKGVPLLGGQGGNYCQTYFMEVTPPTRPGTTLPSTDDDDDGDGDVAGTACSETVSIRPKTGQLQLTWSPVAGAQSYVIRRSTTGPDSAGYSTLVDGHQTTYATYLDDGLTNGDTYWYRVAPKDDQGTEFCTTAAANGTPAARTRTR